MNFDKAAFVPPAAGASVSGATLFGLSVPDWVGVATIFYLVVMAVIKILNHLKERQSERARQEPASD